MTEESYRAYLRDRDRCGVQGIGPLQLTFRAFQDEADGLGGAWKPEVNCWVGFRVFAGLLQRNTVQDALSRWNTGKPGETPYSQKAMRLVTGWQKVIGE